MATLDNCRDKYINECHKNRLYPFKYQYICNSMQIYQNSEREYSIATNH
ncbi:Hypothetical protein ETEE_3121 [Edwardsiella anguillarum ET080813]|uniref:Uncharacterized protein n=1 Tax=Edwardsiella anguillarum ET080813 TaxID=667120 RepID=A0A076LM50_9GAMM|nr:Hypothetical protein ETEE_3121 [Edwardsiella anguillarum ET080813]